MADEQSVSSKWLQIIARVWADEAFKQQLKENPATVLREHGLTPRQGIEVRVVENTDRVAYLTLPAKPAGDVGELSSEQLANVVGGFCCCGTCATSSGGTTTTPYLIYNMENTFVTG